MVALADAIPGMRALSSANLLGNTIPAEQAQELLKIMRSKENLTTLCGLSREETELDFSGQGLGAGDAVLIANDISDMGAMTKLDISKNSLRAEGGRALAVGLKGNQVMAELNIADNDLTLNARATAYDDMSGVTAVADAIKDMRALSSLNLAENCLCGIDKYENGTIDASGNTHPLYHIS
jgi:Ran GTPase-activating protein (RanGAP) involved in mRNA processing and transport